MQTKKISINEMQEMELEILRSFTTFCEQNNLRYWAGYGTLLGAIRHNGFIPWDDDVDIFMPRSDFNKLIKLSPNFSNGHYAILGAFNCNDWPYLFLKCTDTHTELRETTYKSGKIGVYIDIFPMDGLPDNPVMRLGHLVILNVLHYLLITVQKTDLTGKTRVRGLIKKILFPIANKIGIKKLLSWIQTFISKKDFDKAKYVSSETINTYGLKECYERKWFDESICVTFEDYKIKVPKEYDSILNRLYGNYMELPPEEKRTSHHEYVVRILQRDKP